MSLRPGLSLRGLHGNVVHELGLLIGTGQLREGTQLVVESLGHTYGVSRTVVREALRVLESKGMISARPRTGTRVLGVASWDLLDSEVIMWRVHGPGRDRQLRDLTMLRVGIEPVAAREAATGATGAEVEQLFDHCDAMERAVREHDLTAFTQADIAFHTSLLTASGNLAICRLSGAVAAVLSARKALHLMPDRVDVLVVSGHRSIAEAVAAHDAAGAELAVRELVSVAGQEIEQLHATR